MSSDSRGTHLSVAIIARDAELEIAETIRSVHGIADEIVVYDTGSTDGTKTVTQRLATKAVAGSWNGSFGAARNNRLQHVTGEWVLWLDAGEQLDQKDAKALRKFVDAQVDEQKAYMLLVKVPQAGADISSEQAGRIRLVPNRPELRWEGRIRETLKPSLAANGYAVDGIPYVIQRGTRENDPQVKVLRARRNIRLVDLAVKEEGPQGYLLNLLGDAFQALGEFKRAAEFFKHAIAASDAGSIDLLDAYYGLLTSLERVEDGTEQQVPVCLEALESFPLDAQLLCAMGGYLQSQGRLDLATRSYETAHKHGQVEPECWHLDRIHEVSAICYSLSLQLQKQFEPAKAVLQEALEAAPDSVKLRRQMIDLYIKLGKRTEALEEARRLPAETRNPEALRSAIRGACFASQQNWISARAYLEAAYNSGCRDVLCLRWLSLTLLSTGEFEKAEPILEDWQNADPNNVESQQYLAAIKARHESPAAAPQPQPPAGTPRFSTPRTVRVDDEATKEHGKTHGPSRPSISPSRSRRSSSQNT